MNKNPKSEIRNPKQYRMTKTPMSQTVWNLEFRIFAFLVWVFYFWFFIFDFNSNCSFAQEVYLTKIESSRNLGFDYLDIYLSGPTEGKGLLLEDKLIIEFPQVGISKETEIIKVSSKRIKSIQIQEITGEAVKVVVELLKDVDYELVNVFGKNKSIVEIYDQGYTSFPREFAWEKESLKVKAPPLKEKKLEPIGKNLVLSGKIIVIDPAHGGDDPGAFSKSGIPEKHLTLETARKIAYLLQKAGATVYLTRDEDRRNNLSDIVGLANRVSADLFISIHYNAAEHPKISGTETFYYNKNSQRFAAILHKNLIRGIKRRDRGLRRAMFYTVHHTRMPAALVEPLYLTNSEEEKLILNLSFQKQIAWDIVRAIKEYGRSNFN